MGDRMAPGGEGLPRSAGETEERAEEVWRARETILAPVRRLIDPVLRVQGWKALAL